MSGQLRRSGPSRPVRAVHLGLGSFFCAHQAAYTDAAENADEWGIAAFGGRSSGRAEALNRQGGIFTLVTRGAGGDDFSVIRSVSEAWGAADHGLWLARMADPRVAVVTLTVTEAGYGAAPPAETEALRADPQAVVSSAAARLVAGLVARRAAGAAPVTLVPCDNLPDNGTVLAAALRKTADAVDASLGDYLAAQVRTASTVVDRITPAPTAADRALVRDRTGIDDDCAVVTEPFSEWVISGDFPAGRPAWQTAGAELVAHVGPFEERKLWLLNGAHSLLAYVGLSGGLETVTQAVRDPACRALLDQWWQTCLPQLAVGVDSGRGYTEALVRRFDNPRLDHRLDQIAADGSRKLPVRLLPVLARERAAGRLPEAAVTLLAAWTSLLRSDAPPRDVAAGRLAALAGRPLPEAVPQLLGELAPWAAEDGELVSAVRQRVTPAG